MSTLGIHCRGFITVHVDVIDTKTLYNINRCPHTHVFIYIYNERVSVAILAQAFDSSLRHLMAMVLRNSGQRSLPTPRGGGDQRFERSRRRLGLRASWPPVMRRRMSARAACGGCARMSRRSWPRRVDPQPRSWENRGEGASQCRKDLFVKDNHPTVISVATETHVLSVRVVASYRHLGVKFAVNLDIDKEVQARPGAARQAFEQMKKPIFLNRALPVSGRIAFFQSLILSRLLYGSAILSEHVRTIGSFIPTARNNGC